MHPYKGELMMTQICKVAVKNGMEGGNAGDGGGGSEHSVPVIRVLYSFHSSGAEIKRLLGVAPTNWHHTDESYILPRCGGATVCVPP